MYNIKEIVNYLGNPLDGSCRTNIMCFKNGRQQFVSIETETDINKAEVFVMKRDGKDQIYININPYKCGIVGKGKNIDVVSVMNLYIDVDRIKTSSDKTNPATIEEIKSIPIEEITTKINIKYPQATAQHTGNGYRFIIPVSDATTLDERNLVCYMSNYFHEYIDVAIKDASRITGLYGTLNVKEETSIRKNRRRDAFEDKERAEVEVATYTAEELPLILRTATPQATPQATPRTYTKINPDDDMKEPLNQYILNLSKNAPHILLLLATPPVGTHGFALEQFFAAEVINKVGNAPKVFVAICMKIFGSDYDPAATKTAWFRTVQEGVRPWSTAAFTRTFGDYGQKMR